jgi:lipopolysaccharide/colanic/teichoic acid biosynthesis glycosyltransferase
MSSNLTGSRSFIPNEKRKGSKSVRTRYHGNVTEPLVDIDPPFVRKMPIWKRTMDIICSLTGILLLLPFLLLAIIFIKIVSPGPIFFKQDRVGYGGKIFSMLKLRTMHPNSDSSMHEKHMAEIINGDDKNDLYMPISKVPNDPRIIPFGKFLRVAALDELPQLYNILVGDMSLVGPRPPIPYEVDEYKFWHSDRFDVVPGLTGLWQVSGKNKLPFNEMIRLDIRYIQNRSFWLDLKILLLTPSVIISQLRDPQDNI